MSPGDYSINNAAPRYLKILQRSSVLLCASVCNPLRLTKQAITSSSVSLYTL